MEVMIALTIFSIFVATYLTVQGENISDSIRYNQELELHQLCEAKINEIIINPPDLRDQLTLAPDIKVDEERKDYEYKIEWMRMEIPNLSKIQGKSSEEDAEGGGENPVFKMIYDRMRTNIKEMIWQVRVTVKHKPTGVNYTLATWINNPKAKINLGI